MDVARIEVFSLVRMDEVCAATPKESGAARVLRQSLDFRRSEMHKCLIKKCLFGIVMACWLYVFSYVALSFHGKHQYAITVNYNWLPYGVTMDENHNSANLLGRLYFPLICLDHQIWHKQAEGYSSYFEWEI